MKEKEPLWYPLLYIVSRQSLNSSTYKGATYTGSEITPRLDQDKEYFGTRYHKNLLRYM